MKILVLTQADASLNTLRPEAEIFIRLKQAGEEVIIMTGRDSVYWDRWEQAGIRCIDFEPRHRLNLKEIRTVRAFLQEEQIELAYLFNNKAICCGAHAAIGLPTKVVAYRGQTGNIFWYDPSCYLTLLHPRLNAISCVSQAVRDDLRKQLRRPQKAVTLYKGHDPDWYTETPAELKDLTTKPGAFLIACVANNRPRKGIPILLQALAKLPQESRIEVLLLGNGLDPEHIAPLVANNPAAHRVHALGFRNDAPALVAACQGSVLPALKREGLPKTVIEAMAYGIPNIVTDTGGNAELIRDDVDGYVVSPGDADELCQRLQDLEGNPVRSEAMGLSGKQRIADTFHIQDTVAQTRNLFQRLLKESV